MIKKKILVTGASGLVGSRFVEIYKDRYNFLLPGLPDFDITNRNKVTKIIETENPDWVINFAAFTDVNLAEQQSGDESGSAWKINVGGVENLLESFRSKNFLQISTDMVFPGNVDYPGPYDESQVAPESRNQLTWYGWTKNRAEKAVLNRGGCILRIIYPVRAHFDNKLDYIRGALKKYADGKIYPLFADQQICIAYVDEVAVTIAKIVETSSHGVFHCASDTTTPYDLITYTLDQLCQDSSIIGRGSVIEFLKSQSNPNRYPVWGGLKTVNTEERLGLKFSSWQTIVELLIGQGLTLPLPQ